MIMPFLRLVIIYIVVILAALLIFKRDQVMSLMGMSGGNDGEVAAAANEQAKTAGPVAQDVAPDTGPDTGTAPAPVPAETVAQPEAAEQPSKYPTDATAQIGTPADPARTTPAPASANDIQTRLAEARQTYWNRDLAKAETLYKALVADAPNNADVKGELGNLYFAQRRMNEAADMFHRTGLQLIADGNTQQIMPLIGVLQSIAPDKAADLHNRLSQ